VSVTRYLKVAWLGHLRLGSASEIYLVQNDAVNYAIIFKNNVVCIALYNIRRSEYIDVIRHRM